MAASVPWLQRRAAGLCTVAKCGNTPLRMPRWPHHDTTPRHGLVLLTTLPHGVRVWVGVDAVSTSQSQCGVGLRLFTQLCLARSFVESSQSTSVDTSTNACFHRIRSHLLALEKRIRSGIPLDEASSSDVGGCTWPLLREPRLGSALARRFPTAYSVHTVLDMFG